MSNLSASYFISRIKLLFTIPVHTAIIMHSGECQSLLTELLASTLNPKCTFSTKCPKRSFTHIYLNDHTVTLVLWCIYHGPDTLVMKIFQWLPKVRPTVLRALCNLTTNCFTPQLLPPPSLPCSHTLPALLFLKPNSHCLTLASPLPCLSCLSPGYKPSWILHFLQAHYSNGILSGKFSLTLLSKNQPPISVPCTVFSFHSQHLPHYLAYYFCTCLCVCMLIHLPLLVRKLDKGEHLLFVSTPHYLKEYDSRRTAQIHVQPLSQHIK